MSNVPVSTESYTIRRIDHAEPSDRATILPLLREYFETVPGGTDTDARYRWLYLDNPAGPARTYAACVGDRAVGITSLFPRAVRVGERDSMGAIGGDGYVTPSFRRRGIVTTLHREASRAMDAGLSFMFGPPEPSNLRALLRAGAVVTGSVRRYTRPLNARGVGHAACAAFTGALDWLLRPSKSGLRTEKLGSVVDPRVDAIWNATQREASLHGEVVPVADGAFYAWRFGHVAGGHQEGVLVLDRDEPVGVAAVERHGGHAAIVDVTCPRASFRPVVGALMASFAETDAVDIQIHIPSPSREMALHSLGFVPRRTKPFQVQLGSPDPGQTLLTRPSAWKYTWGDGDLEQVL